MELIDRVQEKYRKTRPGLIEYLSSSPNRNEFRFILACLMADKLEEINTRADAVYMIALLELFGEYTDEVLKPSQVIKTVSRRCEAI